MRTWRVLVTDTDNDQFSIERSVLDPLGATISVSPAADEETLAAEARSADAILVGYAPITEPVIAAAAAAGCRAIVRYGIGVDNVDLAAAGRLGVPVANVPDYCLDEVADHTIALYLTVARHIVSAIDEVRGGGWDLPKDGLRRIAGQRFALIGVGRIGRRVAARAFVLGMEVVAYDPFLTQAVPGCRLVGSIEEAVVEADAISLHLPLTPATRHIVDARLLSEMTRVPILLNTARGGLVDLDAVTQALGAGGLRAVALDVFESEPLALDHPLRSDPRALITPHMAYYSVESEADLLRRAAEEVARGLRGEPLLNPVRA